MLPVSLDEDDAAIADSVLLISALAAAVLLEGVQPAIARPAIAARIASEVAGRRRAASREGVIAEAPG